MSNVTIPLFPLNAVLYPSCHLDVQVFEPRYLDMVSTCLREESPFGVISLLSGSEVGAGEKVLANVGCSVRIADWHQQENGVLGLRLCGEQRFRLLSQREQADGLLIGEVEWLPETSQALSDDEFVDLQALLRALASHPMVERLGMQQAPSDANGLVDQLAYWLPLSLEQKIALLGEVSAAERLAQLETLLEALQRANHA